MLYLAVGSEPIQVDVFARLFIQRRSSSYSSTAPTCESGHPQADVGLGQHAEASVDGTSQAVRDQVEVTGASVFKRSSLLV
jgi:hypothetical protein